MTAGQDLDRQPLPEEDLAEARAVERADDLARLLVARTLCPAATELPDTSAALTVDLALCQMWHTGVVVPERQPVIWLGDSLRALKSFSATVQDEVGYASFLAQRGDKHLAAKALTGLDPA